MADNENREEQGTEAEGHERRENNQQEQDPSTGGTNPNPRPKGRITNIFANVNLPKPSGTTLWIIAILIIFGMLALWWFGLWKIAFVIISQIIIAILFTVVIIWGFKDKNANSKYIAIAFIIWGIDLLPGLPLLGQPYAGFNFDLNTFVNSSWTSILFSILFIPALVFGTIREFFKRNYEAFGLGIFILWIFKNISLNFLPSGYFTINILRSSIANYITIAIIFIIFISAFLFRKKLSNDVTEFLTYLFMILVGSFFWVNDFWMGIPRAWIHVIFILIFGFFYIRSEEEKTGNKSTWHLLIPIFLIVDFFLYNILWIFSNSVNGTQFVPVLVFLVLWYCISKTPDNSYATTSICLIALIVIISIIPAYAAPSQSVLFEAREGANYQDFFGQFGDSIRDIIEGRLDIATAGLYRGNVEQNQYESLGVYFGNIRAADPRFYTNEPITVWGTIRSKTYQDAVIVNFSCYRLKDNIKRIYADKIIPNFKFPIFTLEEVDTECTFFPSLEKDKKIKPGPNIITFAAEYNFGTDAYLKSYFIDKDRFRANARENIDPLSQFGIKDKNPVAVFTNGPVEIGLGTGESLITVSEGYAVKPSIDITLTNRQEIKDKDKNIITRWEGKIKNITELILLVPPGIAISNLDKCKEKDIEEKIKCPCSMPFEEYDETKCKNTCKDLIFECNTACVDSYKEEAPNDVSGRLSCINECKTSNEKCESECDFLFKPTGEENLQGDYKGYALDVDSSEFKDINKDIDNTDKHRSFRCRFDPSPGVLDDTPITTRYFRVRAKYNYLIENSVQINVEQSLVSPGTPQESLVRTALDHSFEDPDLLYAIAYVESGLRHCCQAGYGGPGSTCNPSDQKSCTGDKIINSGTSIGVMQVRYYAQDPDLQKRIQDEVRARERKLCGEETIFDFDCNAKLGIDILREKYNEYKNGCTSTYIWRNRDDSEIKKTYPTFLDGCGNGVTSSGVRYDSYREWDAAVRGYNGWGRSSNFDVDYVEKVLNTYKQIKNGQIVDENQIRDYFASRTGSGMISDDSLDQDIQTTTPTTTITKVTGTYDPSNQEVTISWPKSTFAGVTDYEVIRSISNTGHDIVCSVNSDNRNEYSCTNKIQPNEVSFIITYEVLSNAPNQQYTEGRTDVSTY